MIDDGSCDLRGFRNLGGLSYRGNDGRKDVLYHELLDVLTAEGCAICRLARKASDRYINALLYEGVVDVDLRQKLRDARGPCYVHAWRMAGRRGAVLGTAIVYRDVINTLAKELEAPEKRSLLGGKGPLGRGALAQRLAATGRAQPAAWSKMRSAGRSKRCSSMSTMPLLPRAMWRPGACACRTSPRR